ncbi:MAG: nucleoside hydrolase [Rhodobacteraceae bacterium]|nr:nucleoside hydrolase [Paracoccaceae bacterium]
MSDKRRIIIDTDPGQDDAVAILLALASEELEVLGITAVAGNVPLTLTERNARIICDVAGRTDVPVFAGCHHPMTRKLVTAEEVHGKTGLDGMEIFEPKTPLQDMHGVDFILQSLAEHEPGSVTLCPLGPLTNLGEAIARDAATMQRAAEIVLMGGAYFEVGNVTPAAEFNIYVDPEAAAHVFSSGIKTTVMPLDVTHKILTTPERIAAFGALGNTCGAAIVGMTSFYERFDRHKYKQDGAPLHDPCVIAYLLEPGIFQGRFINVEIETRSTLTRGMTVADWWGVTNRLPNATFMGDADADRFFALLTRTISRLP